MPRIWEEDARRRQAVSVGGVLVAEVDDLDSVLAGAQAGQGVSSAEGALDRAMSGIDNIVSLTPLVLATADSARSALLVYASVACRCVLAKCAKMLNLHDCLEEEFPEVPLAKVDAIRDYRIEGLLGVGQLPAWVLFDETGRMVNIAEGAEDAGEARESVLRWLEASD